MWRIFTLALSSVLFDSIEAAACALDAVDLQGPGQCVDPFRTAEPQDPITSFQVVYPKNGSVVKSPLKVLLQIGVSCMDYYTTRYDGMYLCIEILDTVTKCSPVLDCEVVLDQLPEGRYTTRAFITDSDRVVRNHLTDAASFSIVDDVGYAAYTADLVQERRETLQIAKDTNLLEWAQQQTLRHSQRSISVDDFSLLTNTSDPQLVIGVKSAVLTNFARRQAIRETWGQRVKHPNVKVIFLGCVPIMSDIPNEVDRERLRDAVNTERVVYRDLLTEELECEDSYRGLADKVKAFFHLVATSYLQTPYVMLADDDIYLQVDKLLELLQDFRDNNKPVYLGQSWNSVYTRKSAPIREESHRSNLPKAQYPLSELPPYAFGPHYVVSMDCARFISKNYWRLRSLNGLEDVSVGLWLLTMQVHLKHTHQFAHLSFQACKNNLISFADLSPLGIRAAHANVISGRSFCYGYDRIAWSVYEVTSTAKMLDTGP